MLMSCEISHLGVLKFALISYKADIFILLLYLFFCDYQIKVRLCFFNGVTPDMHFSFFQRHLIVSNVWVSLFLPISGPVKETGT